MSRSIHRIIVGATLLALASSTLVHAESNAESKKESLLDTLEIRAVDFDVEKDQVCIHNAGPAGEWAGGDETLAFAVLTPVPHGLGLTDVIVKAPEDVAFDVELQHRAIILRLRPVFDVVQVPGGGSMCFDFASIDLTDNLAFALGRGGPASE